MSQPGSVDEPSPIPSRARRALVRRALLGVGVGAVIAVALAALWLFPYYRDDRVLDRVVRVVALDWRDFGEAEARARLEYELDHGRIGMWVGDEDCVLDGHGGLRQVRCTWRVDVAVPGTSLGLPLTFRSEAIVRPDGTLDP